MLKEERDTPPTEVVAEQEQRSPIQIPTDKQLEDTLVEIVIQDYERAKNYRDTKEYGKDDKGLALKFDSWMDELENLYYGKRKFKTVPWKFCYSKDTEILTDSGWKLVKDIDKSDNVYSINPIDKKAYWMPVTATVSNYYDEMVHFDGKSIDLMVSKDHQMYLERQDGRTYFDKAINIMGKQNNRFIPLTSEFGLNYDPEQIYGFNATDWMRFLGWYVSEGFTYLSGTVSICQSKDANLEKCLEIEGLLTRMGLKFSYSSNKQYLIPFYQFPKEARIELKNLGKADKKYIPYWYLDLNKKLLENLLETLIHGDGCIFKREDRTDLITYYTTSKLLADQIQIIAQKIGKRASVSINRQAGGVMCIRGKSWIEKSDIYITRILSKDRVQCNKLKSTIVPYNDMAYCLETPFHTVYVRRNGIAVWCGNCSNRSMKIAMAIVEMLHSRMLTAVWNDARLKWRAGGLEDVDKKDRIDALMKWWVAVRHKMSSFFDGWVKSVLGYGDVTTKVGWEVKEYDTGEVDATPVIDQMTGRPLVDPMTGQPAIVQEKRIRREETTTAEIVSKRDVFYQPKAKSLEEDPVIIKHTYLYSQLDSLNKNGKVVNINKIKEQVDRNISLPENTPEDRKEILKQVKRRNIPVEIIEWYGRYDFDNDGFEEDIQVLVDPTNRIYVGGVPMTVLTKNGKRPLDTTKFNNRIECPDSLDGLGVLEIVKELSEEIDACFNQMTDANTLSILRPGFYDPAGDVDAPTITLAPNKISPVSNPTRNLFFPDLTIDTTRLQNAIRLVLEFIERLTGASSYVMGKESEIVGGSGTATRTQAIVSAAEGRFSTPAQRLQAGAARILTKILDQIQLNIPPRLEQRVLGEKGDPIFKAGELSEEGISGEYDAYLLEDPSMGDKNMQRQLTDYIYQLLMQNPLVVSDPMKIDKITRDLVEAYESETEAEELLGPKPERKDYDTPEEENTLLIQGDFAKVRALMPENHLHHIMAHQELISSPSFAQLPKGIADQVYGYMMAHIQEHQQMFQQAITNAIALKGGMGGQPGQASPNQGNAQVGGMGANPSPMGQVLNEKRTGESKSPA